MAEKKRNFFYMSDYMVGINGCCGVVYVGLFLWVVLGRIVEIMNRGG